MVQNKEAWIDRAISTMESDATILVANPNWKMTFTEAKAESHTEDKWFYRSYGFSDQCYLIRTSDFKNRIYGEHHSASQRYPRYGGELFEKRIDAYMRNHKHIRITSKTACYLHKNFPCDGLRRWILIWFGINLKK